MSNASFLHFEGPHTSEKPHVQSCFVVVAHVTILTTTNLTLLRYKFVPGFAKNWSYFSSGFKTSFARRYVGQIVQREVMDKFHSIVMKALNPLPFGCVRLLASPSQRRWKSAVLKSSNLTRHSSVHCFVQNVASSEVEDSQHLVFVLMIQTLNSVAFFAGQSGSHPAKSRGSSCRTTGMKCLLLKGGTSMTHSVIVVQSPLLF